MYEIEVRLENFGGLSEKTIRTFLKRVSSASRKALMEDIDMFMQNIEMNVEERSKVFRLLENKLDTCSYFEIQDIRKGSWEFTFVLSGAVYFILQATIGETLKDAWKKTKMRKKLIDWLTSEDILKNLMSCSSDYIVEKFERNTVKCTEVVVKSFSKIKMTFQFNLENVREKKPQTFEEVLVELKKLIEEEDKNDLGK